MNSKLGWCFLYFFVQSVSADINSGIGNDIAAWDVPKTDVQSVLKIGEKNGKKVLTSVEGKAGNLQTFKKEVRSLKKYEYIFFFFF